jgi:beta-lactamase class A
MIRISQTMRHLRRFLSKHRRVLRDAGFGVAGFALLTVLIQIFYPSGRLLPSVEVQGMKLGNQSVAGAQKELDKKYQTASVTVQAGSKKIHAPLAQIGVDIDQAATIRDAASYPLWQRFIPFSSLVIMTERDTTVRMRYDDERLKYFAEQVAKDAYVAPVNATVKVTLGKATLVPAKPSQEFPADKTVKTFRETAFAPKTTLKLKAVNKPAERTDEEVKGVLSEAQKAADKPVDVTLENERLVADSATIGSWLDFAEDTGGNLQLTLKTDAVQKYLEQIQTKIYKAPGTTKIKLVDGKEVERTTGVTGRGIDMPKAIELLGAAIRSDNRTVTVPVVDLAPKVVYERTLSNTDAGLAALLNDIVKAKGNYGIAVMELGGRSGKANGNKQYTAASTYKLFVAYAVFKEIDAGTMHWTDGVVNGMNVEQCFDAMIVKSDNPCAKTLGDNIGWGKIDGQMDGLGLTSTNVASGNMLTTASDLALFLYKLENGTLVSSTHRARLLDAMKRQIYRSGIPAGTGVSVADKVGFIDGLLHDAGIVYGPKRSYVLVIMSNGSSWSQLADAAKQVHNFLKQ